MLQLQVPSLIYGCIKLMKIYYAICCLNSYMYTNKQSATSAAIQENYLITCVQREKSQVTFVTARKITRINHKWAGARGGVDFPFAIFYAGIILIYFRT